MSTRSLYSRLERVARHQALVEPAAEAGGEFVAGAVDRVDELLLALAELGRGEVELDVVLVALGEGVDHLDAVVFGATDAASPAAAMAGMEPGA